MNGDIEGSNAEFWNELCGAGLAQTLGIKDSSPESLKIFDDWYLDYYPYLLEHVRPERMSGKRVLEIGLGYGTVGQKIAEAGADYTGLDIADGPVRMVNQRLRSNNLAGQAVRGSMLHCPCDSEIFDFAVSIGCFHHTGNVQRCFEETYRILKPGGKAVIMLYNALSYRQWLHWPRDTLISFSRDFGFQRCVTSVTSEERRKAYDANMEGKAAPETVFLTIRQMSGIAKNYKRIRIYKENCEDVCFRGRVLIPRKAILSTWGKLAGLDVYIEAEK